MEVKLFTPLVRLEFTGYVRLWREWKDELASELSLTPELLYEAFSDFALASARISLNGLGADFELATPVDNAAELRRKFVAYLNTQTPHVVWAIEREIEKVDAAYEKAIAPQPPSDPEAKSAVANGKKTS